uniref:uncharacterized protein LOC108949904 n=1 Tax=Ciona intestinalis TaxID=7719 RepID=UPI00089DA994|nr:uncharacterized protein LOC108949904 [Ciona intestinalis]|eukprot:XP_018669476.1 uncharacterized protein LOC108949904 [Ciona intestinalis]
MKCIWFMLLVVISEVNSNKPLTSGGSFELSSFSANAKTKAKIGYMMCLPKAPDYVHATARPSDPSLPHKFNVAIIEINRGHFMIELERVDQATGWDTMITVDWSLYMGKGMVYQNIILWFPAGASVVKELNLTQAIKFCAESGGRLVDIVDKAMYDIVYNYCRQTIVFPIRPATHADIWLGSSYNTVADTVTQSNGNPGYNGDWHPGTPYRGDPTDTGLRLSIRPPSSTTSDHGLVNLTPAFDLPVTQLCSANLM